MKRTSLLLMLTTLLLLPLTTSAYWPVTIAENLIIADEPDTNEYEPNALQLANGSVLVTYINSWRGNVYQIIDRFGELQFEDAPNVTPDTPWTPGVYIATYARMVPDSVGGAYVVYYYESGPYYGIWGQRLDSLGNRLWGDAGVRLLTAASADFHAAGDGVGGLLVACSRDWDVHAQHADQNGNLFWGDSGIPVSVGAISSHEGTIAHDGDGGAFVTWEQGQFGYDLVAQHFDAAGNPLWTENLVINPGGSWYNSPVPDGEGGFILDMNNNGNGNDLYRINSDGVTVWHHENLSYFIDTGLNKIVTGEENFVYLGFFWDNHFRGQKVDIRGNIHWDVGGAWFNYSLGGEYAVAYPDYAFRDPNFYIVYAKSPTEYGPFSYYISGLDQQGNRILGDNGVLLQTTHFDGYQRSIVPVDDGGIVAILQYRTQVNPNQYDTHAKRVNPDGTLGGPLHLLVDLEPQSSSIQIPPAGGTFIYNIAIEDTYVVHSDFDAWIEVAMPGGDTREITLRQGIHIDSNSVIERFDLVQNVPDWAPAGDYTYTLFVGDHDYPDWFWAMDEFGFEKLATAPLAQTSYRATNPPLPPLNKGGKTQHPPYQAVS